MGKISGKKTKKGYGTALGKTMGTIKWFNGIEYILISQHSMKKHAIKMKERLKKGGFLARVLRSPKYILGNYWVFRSVKKRRK